LALKFSATSFRQRPVAPSSRPDERLVATFSGTVNSVPPSDHPRDVGHAVVAIAVINRGKERRVPGAKLVARLDRVRVLRASAGSILSNLCANAIEYTPAALARSDELDIDRTAGCRRPVGVHLAGTSRVSLEYWLSP
jgi:hypothetical protein